MKNIQAVFVNVSPLEVGDELIYAGGTNGEGKVKLEIVDIIQENSIAKRETKFLYELAVKLEKE